MLTQSTPPTKQVGAKIGSYNREGTRQVLGWAELVSAVGVRGEKLTSWKAIEALTKGKLVWPGRAPGELKHGGGKVQ